MHKWWLKTGGSLFKQLNGSKPATRKLTSGRPHYPISPPRLNLHSSHESFKRSETNNPVTRCENDKVTLRIDGQGSLGHQQRKLPSTFCVHDTGWSHQREQGRGDRVIKQKGLGGGNVLQFSSAAERYVIPPTVVINGVARIKLQTCYCNQGRLKFESKFVVQDKERFESILSNHQQLSKHF
jgi:hypothetical protein